MRDFFQPLGPFNLLGLGVLLMSIDIIGHALNSKYFKLSNVFRPAYWFFGLGVWSLWLFVGHWWLPFMWQWTVLPVLALAFVIRRNYKFPNISGFLFVVPILIPLFVKLSLPPHMWDEMAYHWYSPAQATFEQKWNFAPGLFNNVPRLIETINIALFQAFKTYSVSRLANFLVFFSTVCVFGNYLKERFGKWVAIVGQLLLLYFGYNTLSFSTSGYVDVFSASFLFLALLVLLRAENILAIIAFLSLALGTKYTSASPSIAILIVMAFLNKARIFQKNLVLGSLLVFCVMGGYWYVKNTILLKNPVYPLFFSCDEAYCYKKENFFGGWTKPIRISNVQTIISELAENSSAIEILVYLIILVILLKRNSINKDLRLVLAVFLLDWTISSYTTSFMVRYFVHWQFLLVLFVCLILGSRLRIKWVMGGLATIIILYTIGVSWSYLLKNPIEYRYAFRKINIYDWVDIHFPEMSSVIHWCDSRPGITMSAFKDPNLIWANYEGMFRIFLTNCFLSDIEKTKVHNKFYFFSFLDCGQPTIYPEHEPWHLVNQSYICNSKKVSPHVFEYEVK